MSPQVSLLLACMTLFTAAPALAQAPLLDDYEWRVTDGAGNPLEDSEGNPLDVYACYTYVGYGQYLGEAGIMVEDEHGDMVKKKLEENLTFTVDDWWGVYEWVNLDKDTWGDMYWNDAGYFETWSSYGGGTTRRMYPR